MILPDLAMARLSAIAYEPDQRLARALLRDEGYPEARFYSDAATGADALLCWNETATVFAARGTGKNYADILTDLKFKRVQTRFGGVHKGFDDAWRAIGDEVGSDIEQLSARRPNTIATGHSLGGAVALRAAADLNVFERTVTFGAPRIGDRAFCERLRAVTNHRRYTRGAGIVPLLPLLAMGFRHDVPSFYIDAAGRPHSGAPLWRELAGRACALLTGDWVGGGRWPVPVPKRMFTDHQIAGYIGDLERLAAAIGDGS